MTRLAQAIRWWKNQRHDVMRRNEIPFRHFKALWKADMLSQFTWENFPNTYKLKEK